MAVSFQTLFAAALPPGPLVTSNATGVSTNSLIPQSTFSSALNSAIQQANPNATSTPATDSNPTNNIALPRDETGPVDGLAVPVAVAAPLVTTFGGTFDAVLTTSFDVTASEVAVLTTSVPQALVEATADPTAVDESPTPVPVPNLPLSEQDTSRTQQLRFQFSGATRGPRTAVVTPATPSTIEARATRSPTADAEVDAFVSGGTSPVAPTLPSIPQTTVADSARIASRVQATALTNPQVVDRGLALPTAPPQLGYGAERPPVLAAAETTAAPPVAVGNRPGASSDRVATAQLAAEQLRPAAVPAAKSFAPILASSTVDASATPVASGPTPVLAAPPPAPGETAASSVAATIPKTTPIPPRLAPPTASLPNPVAAPVRVEIAPSIPTASTVRITPAVSGVELSLATRDVESPATNTLIPQTLPTASSAGAIAVDRPAAGAKTDVPSAPEQIAQSVVSQVRVLSKDETVEYSIRLDPPDLGRVQIRLISTGDNLSAHVTVANDAVRQMLESQLPELRQRLEQAGVNATQIDVSTQTAGQQAGSGDGNSRWQDARQEYPFFRSPDLPPAVLRSRVAIGSAGSGGRLDVTA